VRVFRLKDERAEDLASFPPRIGHRLSKRSRTIVGRSDGTDGLGEEWIPSRIWVD